MILDDYKKYFSSNSDLDTRVVDLEENGGGDGNSSVAELEVRVETLEGTASDHETRLMTAEAEIEGLSREKIIKFKYPKLMKINLPFLP